jgi:predicted metal-dependent hydrolase
MHAAPTPEVRNRRFAIDAKIPRHWLGGRRSVTTFFDNLSIFFPLGEQFFIDAVKHYRSRVTDEKLRRDVAAFCAQEGIHRREHERYNAMLVEQGYPVEDLEGRVDRLLAFARRRLPMRWQLGVTCALEHFTALMGEMILRDPAVLEGADATMAALWRWHAAEESEHRAVAFDVFQATKGSYRVRAATMLIASVMFWLKVVEHQTRMMAADGTATSLAEWRALVTYLFREPGGFFGLIPAYFDYYRPTFHPHERSTEVVLAAWKRSVEEKAAA